MARGLQLPLNMLTIVTSQPLYDGAPDVSFSAKCELLGEIIDISLTHEQVAHIEQIITGQHAQQRQAQQQERVRAATRAPQHVPVEPADDDIDYAFGHVGYDVGLDDEQ